MSLYDEQRKSFEEMKAASLDSLQSFVDFHLEEREKVREGTQQYFGTCAELTVRRDKQKDRINILLEEKLELEEKIKAAMNELENRRSKLKELSVQHEASSARKASLLLQLNETRSLIRSMLREKEYRQAYVNRKETKLLHDCIQCEKFLGLSLDSVDANVINFTFTNLDPTDSGRRYTVALDIGLPLFTIVEMLPKLLNEIALGLEKKLNDSQDMKLFLKLVREEFKKIA